MCVEPNVDYLPELAHRKCTVVRAAIGSPEDKTQLFTFGGAGGGFVGDGFDNKHERQNTKKEMMHMLPLSELLRKVNAPPVIDLFSLDVEGAESIVMESFPWSTHRFKVLLVERPKPDLSKALIEHGYVLLRGNAIFNDETWVDKAFLPSVMQFAHRRWSDLPQHSCMDASGHHKPAGHSINGKIVLESWDGTA